MTLNDCGLSVHGIFHGVKLGVLVNILINILFFYQFIMSGNDPASGTARHLNIAPSSAGKPLLSF